MKTKESALDTLSNGMKRGSKIMVLQHELNIHAACYPFIQALERNLGSLWEGGSREKREEGRKGGK